MANRNHKSQITNRKSPAGVPEVMGRGHDLRHMRQRRWTGRIVLMLKLTLALHIAAGTTALVSMWVLLFVSILTAASVSSGVRVLRAKNRVGPHLHWWDIGVAALLTASSVAAAVYGFVTG